MTHKSALRLCLTPMPIGKECQRPADHDGEHEAEVEYRQIKMHPWAQVKKNFEANCEAGAYCLQSWTCVHCGAIQRMSQVNGWFNVGGCENCGKDTDLVKHGCNFTLMAVVGGQGGKPEFREWLKKMGFTPPREN